MLVIHYDSTPSFQDSTRVSELVPYKETYKKENLNIKLIHNIHA